MVARLGLFRMGLTLRAYARFFICLCERDLYIALRLHVGLTWGLPKVLGFWAEKTRQLLYGDQDPHFKYLATSMGLVSI